jgi:hypothetical protein
LILELQIVVDRDDAIHPAREVFPCNRCSSVCTRLKLTTPRSVSTSTREKFERLSLVNFVCTAVGIDASLIVWPAVFPVMD